MRPSGCAQSVQPIDVMKINKRHRRGVTDPEKQQGAKQLIVVALDIEVDMPGPVFVRCRGLDSEWRGRLGASAASRNPP